MSGDFGAELEPEVAAGGCPHMAVLLRSTDELPGVWASFYALGLRRNGWIVHHCLPGCEDLDRASLRDAGFDLAPWEERGRVYVYPVDVTLDPAASAAHFTHLLDDALARGLSAMWYARFPVGDELYELATPHDQNWHRAMAGKPVITLCPYVVGDLDDGSAAARRDELATWHDHLVLPSGAPGEVAIVDS